MKRFFDEVFNFIKKVISNIFEFIIGFLLILALIVFGVFTIFLIAIALFPIGLACGTGFITSIFVNILIEAAK